MGSSPAKPEFNTHLADETVEAGADVILRCKVNTEAVTVTWKKNNQKLSCVQGKHTVKQIGTSLSLEISKAEEGDEGKYTVDVTNSSGSDSCSAMVVVVLKKWREMPPQQDILVKSLKNFKICKDVTELRFLLHGPVGAGKSSIINTIKSIFENRPFLNCLASSGSSTSFTLHYQKFTVGSEHTGLLPFVFYDVMGLEEDEQKGEKKGMHTDDIISALKGHIPEGYKFQPYPMTDDNKTYISSPTLNDKIHCLVSVVPADNIKLMANNVIDKMKIVRKAASECGIPQMVFMTRVDLICPMTKNDISKLYQSKKIKEKVQECSYRLGVPENCIFLVKNYHNEIELNEQINCLMLAAFKQAVFSANDYVERCGAKQKHFE
ncbi:interferon-induced protein 44-like [Salminus brasiliensis]|uniref:interferon-induced protein 44-like n=1 Tax=Salminus brasiliensis TaxID=930266 RepID=UPI003B831C94